MRLSPRLVDLMAFEVAHELMRANAVDGDEARLVAVIKNAINEDLAVEDALDEEVTELLVQYQDYMRQNQVEYADMFEKIKRKLVQERKLIL